MIKIFIQLIKELRSGPGFKWRYLYTRRWQLDDGRLLTTYQFVRFLKENDCKLELFIEEEA